MDGIYFHRRLPKAIFSAYSVLQPDNSDLWYGRLGHPSNNVVKYFIGKSCHSRNNCTICFCAKQTRDQFPLSLSTTTASFDLVHYEL